MYNIGVDLGGTNIAAGLVDATGALVFKAGCPTNLPQQPEDIAQAIDTLVANLCAAHGVPMAEVASVGVGIPGTINHTTGVLEYANNFGFQNVPFLALLQAHFLCPVRALNDAAAAALGEYLAGAGKGTRSMVAITLGTGVGGGIILNGKLWEGANDAAGELGHMVIHSGGRPCTCGRNGCLEAYASATALVRRGRETALATPTSLLAKQGDALDGKAVFAAVQQGDAAACALFDDYVTDLAEGVANIINILQPELVCIGGGLSGAGDLLLQPLRKKVQPMVYSRYSGRNARLELACLGNDAGIFGAAGLYQTEMRK